MLSSQILKLFVAAYLIVGALLATPCSYAQSYSDLQLPNPLPPGSTIIIGFTGGVERWNDDKRPVRRLALDLSREGHPNTYTLTVEHWHRGLALKAIREALSRGGGKRTDDQERPSMRIILYGHSMGGVATIKLARQLNKLGVPVLLTIQVDGVGRSRKIPPNVARAANFFQHSSHLIRGKSEIVAEDPTKTTILGNFEYQYKDSDVDLGHATMIERAAHTAHSKMEFDPAVWAEVRAIIEKELQ